MDLIQNLALLLCGIVYVLGVLGIAARLENLFWALLVALFGLFAPFVVADHWGWL